MKHKITQTFLFVTLALFLFACSPQVVEVAAEAPSSAGMDASEARVGYVQYDSLAAEPASEMDKAAAPPAEQPAQEPIERLIIRNGDLSITVENTEETLDAIAELTNSSGGWVVTSSSRQYGESLHGSINIRFPAEQFDNMINQVQDMAVEVENVNTSGQDVTDEFIDLGSRLSNLEATADRVRLFLDETENVEEALAVNQELSRLEGEIEVIKGRMKFLSESAAYSTLTVQIRPDVVAQPITVARWLPFEVAEDATEALLGTLQGLANFVIWAVIYLLPVGILIGLPLWFGGRWVVRKWQARRQNSQLEPAAAAAE